MLWRVTQPWRRPYPEGFIVPCQPTLSARVPAGPEWLHEIKHDGYRIIALKDGDRVRLWSRHARDWTREMSAIAEAVRRLPYARVLIDGEAVAHENDGGPNFWRLVSRGGAGRAMLYAFDLLQLDTEDLRQRPCIERRARLAELLASPSDALCFSEAFEGEDGPDVLRHACRLGLEGVVSKRRDAPYRSGRVTTWRKIKCDDYRRRARRPT